MAAKKLSARPAGSTAEKCCCDPAIITECKTRSGSATLCGWAEYIPSIPPRLYKTKEQTGEFFQSYFYGADCTGSQWTGTRNVHSGSSTREPYQGTCAESHNGVHQIWYYPAYTGNPATTYTSVYEAAIGQTGTDTLTATTKREDGVGCVPGQTYRVDGWVLNTLTDEDTEAMAEARSGATWSGWHHRLATACDSCCVANRSARTTTLSYTFSFRAAKFRLGITEGPPDVLYQVAVDYVRKPIGSGTWTLVATEYFAVTSGPDPVIDPPVIPVVEPPVAHDLWPEYPVPQLAGYETTIDNIRIYHPEP